MHEKSKSSAREKRGLLDHKRNVEDERGWAGQRGQRPENEEESSYRPGQASAPERKRKQEIFSKLRDVHLN